MFAKRPRFDDTFGVRMDLGADRMDPMSLRPSSRAGQLRVKTPVIVERPLSFFGMFGTRDRDPLAALRETPSPAASPAVRAAPGDARPPARRSETGSATRPFEDGLLAIWRRLSASQRIWLSIFAGLFLISSGLWLPAVVIAVVYFTLRGRAA